jgi:predicted lipoprotein with Yx(FWY)xxD motif
MKRTLILAALSMIGTVAHADLLEKNVVSLSGGKEAVALAHPSGLTLYTFDLDNSAPGASVCDGTCAEKWPPYILDATEISTLAAPLSVVVRKSGLKQLAISGKPVYLFYDDRVRGDAKGDGVGSVWHIVPVVLP